MLYKQLTLQIAYLSTCMVEYFLYVCAFMSVLWVSGSPIINNKGDLHDTPLIAHEVKDVT
jgi:hypothetical protein